MKEPIWLTRAILEAIHNDQIREHGGSPGIRDPSLLDSAIARPQNTWEYDANSDLAALAADYGFGIAKNHPFVDGNKRVAFIATNVFLLLNGHEIETSEPEVVNTILRLADGRLSRNKYAAWIRENLVRYE